MKSFFTPTKIWPSGPQLLHVYYLPDQRVLAPLLDVYEPILAAEPALAPVPRVWLHATLLKIAPPAGAVDAERRSDLAARLQQRLRSHPPMSFLAGPALAGASAVVLDLTPDDAWNSLRTAATTIVDGVLGSGSAVASTTERPHITLAYGVGDADSGVIQSQLRRASDRRAQLDVTQVHLVDVVQDTQQHGYQWTAVAALPLGSGCRPRSS